jgi:hypothetical protein
MEALFEATRSQWDAGTLFNDEFLEESTITTRPST